MWIGMLVLFGLLPWTLVLFLHFNDWVHISTVWLYCSPIWGAIIAITSFWSGRSIAVLDTATSMLGTAKTAITFANDNKHHVSSLLNKIKK
jgi:hypothetical protein